MRNRTRAMAVGVSLAASVLLLQGSAVGAGTGNDRGGHTMTFRVLFQPFNYTDLGTPGPSAADVIVFHDQLLQSGKNVGDEVGSCVLVDETGLSNCSGVIQLENDGTITFSFVNAPPPHKVLAVTGGSGDYQGSSWRGHCSTRTKITKAPSFCGSSAGRHTEQSWLARAGGTEPTRLPPEIATNRKQAKETKFDAGQG